MTFPHEATSKREQRNEKREKRNQNVLADENNTGQMM